MSTDLQDYLHKRLNRLTREWVLSPHRAKRPWQGQTEDLSEETPLRTIRHVIYLQEILELMGN